MKHPLNYILKLFSILITISIATGLLAISSSAADKLVSDEEKVLYAVGLVVGRQLSVFDLTPDELQVVQRGMMDVMNGKTPEVDIAAYGQKVQLLAKGRRKLQGDKQAVQNRRFLEDAAKSEGAVKTESGLVFISQKKGDGATPGPKDTVTVNYRGTFPDGKEFDSSYKRGKPFEFKLDSVIKCWSEGLRKMNVGGSARLVCPSSIAYGDKGAGEMILPGATLIYDIELLAVKQ